MEEDLLIGVALALFSAAVGGVISTYGARKQREWSEGQAVRQRQDDAAARFDEELLEALAPVPKDRARSGDAEAPLREAFKEVREAWGRASRELASEATIRSRYDNLFMVLFMGSEDTTGGNPDHLIHFHAIKVARDDLRDALSAFVLRKQAQEPDLPPQEKLIQVATQGDHEFLLDGVFHDFLMDRMAEEILASGARPEV